MIIIIIDERSLLLRLEFAFAPSVRMTSNKNDNEEPQVCRLQARKLLGTFIIESVYVTTRVKLSFSLSFFVLASYKCHLLSEATSIRVQRAQEVRSQSHRRLSDSFGLLCDLILILEAEIAFCGIAERVSLLNDS